MGALQANRARHNSIRDNPSRPRILLREAVDDAGLYVIGYEHEVADPDNPGRPVWYDIMVEIRGQPAAIFLADRKHRNRKVTDKKRNNLNVSARQNKIDLAKKLDMPYLEIFPGSKMVMRAHIELWLMLINRDPFRDAPKYPAKITKMKRPFKSRRLT